MKGAARQESRLMRRLTLILLAFVFTTSACFGTSGTWRCANGTPCAFTRGIGFHCPGVKPGAVQPPVAARPTGGMCSHCRPQTLARSTSTAASGPCASVCRGCSCKFTVISSHVPATTAHVLTVPGFDAHDIAAILISSPVAHAGFNFRPIVFTTGPPAPSCTKLPLTTPSRAPPRLYCI